MQTTLIFLILKRMKEIKKESKLVCYQNMDEMEEADCLLLLQAKKSVNTAYAPYSKFQVGCALRLSTGEIITGSNQENLAYPSGLCAERVAIFAAGAKFPDTPVVAMAITVKAMDFEVTTPIMSCGACLQSISEYEMRHNQPIRMILQGESGEIYVAEGTTVFMPFQFRVPEWKT